MKNKFLAVLFIAAAAIGFTSCSSDDSSPVNSNGETLFTVTIDGETFVGEHASAIIDGNDIYIDVQNESGESLSLSIPGAAVGTYANVPMYYNESWEGPAYNNDEPGPAPRNGILNITDIQEYSISGTFNFTGYSGITGTAPKIFTNGVFQNIPLGRLYNAQGTISAKINGQLASFSQPQAYFASDIIVISGYNMQSMQVVEISLPGSVAPGTYQLNSNANRIIISNTNYPIISTQGTVTVTSNSNGFLSGTFNFTGLDDDDQSTHQVTEGVFSINLN